MTSPGVSSSRVQAATISGEETRAYTLQAIPPQAFAKYTLIGKLGHGGMAEVLLAVMGGKGGFRKLVVLKRLHSQLEAEPGFIDMFLDEARLAAQLDHPHCVQTLEVGEAGDQHFLAMEFLDGQGLERLLRSSAQSGHLLPVPVAARMIADALEGLGYAHELTSYDGRPLGVVHRDVSPQNIFVTYAGVVKLLDFGIAKAESNVVETRTGVVKGKYAYIAPEQALAQPVDQRADVWSMGVVLWECLTSRRLFKSVNELATLQETLQGEIKPPSVHNPEVPPELDVIVMRALQRDVSRRYQTARDFRGDLERWLTTQRPQPTRQSIAALMTERFEEVQRAHKEKLAACLASLEVGPSSIQRLVDPSSPGMSSPGTDAGISGQFAHMTPSSAHRIATSSGPASFTPPPLTPSHPGLAAPHPMAATQMLPQPAATPSQPPGESRRRATGWKLVVVGAIVLLAVLVALILPRGEEPTASPDGTVATALPAAPPPVPEPVPEPVPDTPGLADPVAVPDPVEPVAVVEPAPATPDPAPESTRRSTRRDRGRTEGGAATTTTTAPTPPVAPAGEDGFLSLVTSPWTSVSLGGRDLGTTPLVRVRLPAGRHVLRLTNDDAGITETYEVEIRAGETTTRRLGLR